MNQLQKVFNYEGHQVRTITKDGQPWFVAKDILFILGLTNISWAIERLDQDEFSLTKVIDSLGREQETFIINEPGLYSLILGSRKEESKPFKRWITHEVLPSIRKTGSYELQKPQSIEDLIIMQANSMKELKTQVSGLEVKATRSDERFGAIQETFLKRDEDWRKSINQMLNNAVRYSSTDYRELRSRSYHMLEDRAHCRLNVRLSGLKDRLEESGATKTKINNTNKLDVIESEPRLKEIYTTIVKELSIGSLV